MVALAERQKGRGFIQRTLAAIRAGLQGETGMREAVTRWVDAQPGDFTMHDLCRGALHQDLTRMTREQVIRLSVLLRDVGCTRTEKRVAGHRAKGWWKKPPVRGRWEIIDKD